jgi:hypothetical protein
VGGGEAKGGILGGIGGWFALQRSMSLARLPYLWDYDIDETTFEEILAGRKTLGRLDRDWAAVRLLEYAPYKEIVQRLGYRSLVEDWPRWRPRIRSEGRRRGFDFLASWLPEKHPELLYPLVEKLDPAFPTGPTGRQSPAQGF